MDTLKLLEGLVNTKQSPIVICDIDYRIVFMNSFAAEKYKKYGGRDMVGKPLSLFCSTETMSKVNMVVEWFKEGRSNNIVFAAHKEETNEDFYVTAIRDENQNLIGFSSLYENRTPEQNEAYRMD